MMVWIKIVESRILNVFKIKIPRGIMKKRFVKVIDSITSLRGRLPIQITRLVKYLSSGIITSVIDIFLLIVFVEVLGLYYIYSAVMSFMITHSIHYTINKNWGFRESDSGFKRGYFYFIIFGIVVALLIAVSLGYMVEVLELHYLIAKIIIVGFFGCFNFLINYFITFKMGSEILGIFGKKELGN